MPSRGTIRQNGKFVKRGIEHKIAETHMSALNQGLAMGMGPKMAHAMGDMAVNDMLHPPEKPTLVIIGKAK